MSPKLLAALGALVVVAGTTLASTAASDPPAPASAPPISVSPDGRGDARAVVDRVAIRFYAPETGGVAHPRFINERILAFEARLDALCDEGARATDTQDERRLKNAMDRHITEELLATLDETSGVAASADLSRLAREVRADTEQRAGGANPIWLAAEEEGLSADEVQSIFRRRARAAAYVDRALSRFLRPEDEQLREVYRTTQHPFRDRPYEDIRGALSRWFVFERLKALEASFLQTARARVTIVVVPR